MRRVSQPAGSADGKASRKPTVSICLCSWWNASRHCRVRVPISRLCRLVSPGHCRNTSEKFGRELTKPDSGIARVIYLGVDFDVTDDVKIHPEINNSGDP